MTDANVNPGTTPAEGQTTAATTSMSGSPVGVTDSATGGSVGVTDPTAIPQSWVNADGTLKEGWQDNLVPTDFRGRKVYSAVGNDVAGLLRHIGHQDIAISKQGKGVFVPGPEASETEKDFFYKAIGRPDKAEEYKIDIPEADDGTVAEARNIFHRAGLTQGQVDAIIAYDKQRMEAAAKDLEENPVKYFEELLPKVEPIYKAQCEEKLRQIWGDAYDARLHLANRAIAENTKEGEERDTLTARIGNDPLVADFIATIMNKHFTDGSGVNTATGSPAASSNIAQRIDELQRDPNYMDGRTNPARHKQVIEEVLRLRTLLNPGNVGG